MIYAIDEIQNPLLHKTMLFARHMNSTGGRTHAFPNNYVFWTTVQLCKKGNGVYILMSVGKMRRGWKIPNTV